MLVDSGLKLIRDDSDTAIVRSRNEWNHVGDSRVTRMDESEVRKVRVCQAQTRGCQWLTVALVYRPRKAPTSCFTVFDNEKKTASSTKHIPFLQSVCEVHGRV